MGRYKHRTFFTPSPQISFQNIVLNVQHVSRLRRTKVSVRSPDVSASAHLWKLISCPASTAHVKQHNVFIPLYLSEQDFLSPSALSTHGCTVKLSVASRTLSVRIQRESSGWHRGAVYRWNSHLHNVIIIFIYCSVAGLQAALTDGPRLHRQMTNQKMSLLHKPCFRFTLQPVPDRPILANDHRLHVSLSPQPHIFAIPSLHRSWRKKG